MNPGAVFTVFEKPLDVSDPACDAVFKRPLDWCVRKREAADAAYFAIFHLLDAEGDHAMASIGDCAVAHEVNCFLRAILPGYSKLDEVKDTSSRRIELARSLHLCPSRIWDDADEICQTQNKFDHKLEIDSFDRLDNDWEKRIRDRLRKYGTATDGWNRRDLFSSLATCVVMALRTYTFHAEALNAFIRSDKLIPLLESFHATASPPKDA